MKCLICNKEFTGNLCPRCGFPVVESTDVDALLESMSEQIKKFRSEFRAGLKLALSVYSWKADGASIVPNEKTLMYWGDFNELCGELIWLKQKFARIPDSDKLKLEVSVSTGEDTQSYEVLLPNLNEPSLQYVGIETDDEMRFRLWLKNDLGNTASSDWITID